MSAAGEMRGDGADVTGGATARLVAALRQAGVEDGEFETLLGALPVEEFVPFAHRDAVTTHRWLPIECGQSMTPPFWTARLAQAAGIEPTHSVLEIGTGTGYLTALLARRARKVLSLDRYRTLLQRAQERCGRFGITNAAFERRDGSVPRNDGALYDRIVIDSAFEQVPRQYLDALASGGCLVCAVGPLDGEQELLRLTKIGARFDRQRLFRVRFNGLERGVATAL